MIAFARASSPVAAAAVPTVTYSMQLRLQSQVLHLEDYPIAVLAEHLFFEPELSCMNADLKGEMISVFGSALF